MTSLAERAHAAAVFIHRNTIVSPHGPYRGEEHARIAVRLAAALGLGLDQVTTEPDWLRRRTTPGEPVLATATCPETNEKYVFLARFPIYDDEAFELLGPCPECSGQVPLALVRHLADLGTHLARPPLTPGDTPQPDTVPDTFGVDEGHTSPCRYGEAL
ncbi:hypothetical protein GQF42_35260 [Streptomyces broussonetiae]|uniref:Uncharacterized protein n=1 Tax=Streptomyces broussonetiae TaxID=2686304 RepID=A0A6I6N8L1_9ACTN|nr:hypothetical protein [Streptomyces broussonetiae]QHA07854.1 hypothetical protein GQF42_35260 [Streptomyces broussonetiae]